MAKPSFAASLLTVLLQAGPIIGAGMLVGYLWRLRPLIPDVLLALGKVLCG